MAILRLWHTLFSIILTGMLAYPSLGFAQASSDKPSAPVPQTRNPPPPTPGKSQQNLSQASPHLFWDKQNDWLFAAIAASRTLDYFSTLNMRRRGRQEILLTDDVVDNHAGFAAIEAAATGASIGASYLFHRYNHHKLERWTSYIHIGLTTGGAVRNYCLKTAHFAATSTPSFP